MEPLGTFEPGAGEASQANAHRRDVTTGSLLVAACERLGREWATSLGCNMEAPK